ncbi:MAG: MlaD family protein [candidate division WOR-3 bacterium]
MIKKEKAIKVGIFLTIVILIFVLGQLWLLSFNVGKRGYYLHIFYNDVSGLKEGDPVRVYGITKGKVVNMEMRKDGVMVKVWLEKSIVLKEDARASIQDVAMISGTKTIVMDPGVSDNFFDIRDTLKGEPSLGLSTVQVGEVAGKFDELVKALKRGLEGGEGTLLNLQRTLKEAELILKENRKGLKKLVESGGGSLSKAEDLISKLNLSLEELDLALKKINNKEGSLGKLIYDEKLYDNLVKATANLDSLLLEVRKNPGRFLRISVF